MNTSDDRQRATAAASSAMARTPSAPALPVKALALPLLTTSTRASPPFRLPRHHNTGALAVLEVVNTPATWVPVASRTPAKGGGLVKVLGAKGDSAGLLEAF